MLKQGVAESLFLFRGEAAHIHLDIFDNTDVWFIKKKSHMHSACFHQHDTEGHITSHTFLKSNLRMFRKALYILLKSCRRWEERSGLHITFDWCIDWYMQEEYVTVFSESQSGSESSSDTLDILIRALNLNTWKELHLYVCDVYLF